MCQQKSPTKLRELLSLSDPSDAFNIEENSLVNFSSGSIECSLYNHVSPNLRNMLDELGLKPPSLPQIIEKKNDTIEFSTSDSTTFKYIDKAPSAICHTQDEVQILKDQLEREKVKRQNCERIAKDMQIKVLRLEQEAVAIQSSMKDEVIERHLKQVLQEVWSHSSSPAATLELLQREKEKTAQLEVSLAQLQTQLEEIAQASKSEQEKKQALRETDNKLQAQLGVCKEENRKLKEDLSQSQHQLAEHIAHLAQSQTAVEQSQTKVKEQEVKHKNKIKKLENDLLQSQIQAGEIRKNLEAKLQESQKHRKNLERQLENSQNLVEELKAKLQQSGSQVNQIKNQADNLESELTKTKQLLEARLEKAISEVQTYQIKTEHLEKEVDQIQSQKEELESLVGQTQAEVELLKGHLEERQKQMEDLEAKLDQREEEQERQRELFQLEIFRQQVKEAEHWKERLRHVEASRSKTLTQLHASLQDFWRQAFLALYPQEAPAELDLQLLEQPPKSNRSSDLAHYLKKLLSKLPPPSSK